jgi:hypothetical protein
MNKPTILIGNGFNLALDPNIKLGYREILEKLIENIKKNNDSVSKYLQNALNSNSIDIEALLNELTISEKSCERLLAVNDKITGDCLSSIQETLKNSYLYLESKFMATLSELHPNGLKDLFKNHKELERCIINLNTFESIITINFDLILYWIINTKLYDSLIEKAMGKKPIILTEKFSDGFSTVKNSKYRKWNKDLNPNLIYLHGAIHLFEDLINADEPYKLIRADNINVINQARNNINDKKAKSLTVFGPSSNEKLVQILRSSYLKTMYDNLGLLEGTIFIYGCTPASLEGANFTDQHIWDKINHSKVESIYYGCINDNEMEKVKKYVSAKYQKNRVPDLYFFNSNECNIFTTPDFLKTILANSRRYA